MRVLLANDSSPNSKAASDYLLALPLRKPIDLEIVSAVSPPIMVDANAMGVPADLSAFLVEECKSARERIEKTAKEWVGPVHSVQTHVPVGPPSTELLSLAEDMNVDFVVLGAVGHSAIQRVLLGSVSDYVATHCDATTLVVRPPIASSGQPEINRIVIALSGQAEDERMIDWLREFKFSSNVEIHLVRILQLPKSYHHDIQKRASGFWNTFVDEAQLQLEKMEANVQELGLNTGTHLVHADHIGEGLVDYIEQNECDLAMTGDSDSGLLTRVFLGSTSRYVLRHARCSVMIVRDKEERQAAKREKMQAQVAKSSNQTAIGV